MNSNNSLSSGCVLFGWLNIIRNRRKEYEVFVWWGTPLSAGHLKFQLFLKEIAALYEFNGWSHSLIEERNLPSAGHLKQIPSLYILIPLRSLLRIVNCFNQVSHRHTWTSFKVHLAHYAWEIASQFGPFLYRSNLRTLVPVSFGSLSSLNSPSSPTCRPSDQRWLFAHTAQGFPFWSICFNCDSSYKVTAELVLISVLFFNQTILIIAGQIIHCPT